MHIAQHHKTKLKYTIICVFAYSINIKIAYKSYCWPEYLIVPWRGGAPIQYAFRVSVNSSIHTLCTTVLYQARKTTIWHQATAAMAVANHNAVKRITIHTSITVPLITVLRPKVMWCMEWTLSRHMLRGNLHFRLRHYVPATTCQSGGPDERCWLLSSARRRDAVAQPWHHTLVRPHAAPFDRPIAAISCPLPF